MAKTWVDKVADLRTRLGREPRLEELVETARHHTMTRQEWEAQRRSWVVGNICLSTPDMSREEIENIYDRMNKGVHE